MSGPHHPDTLKYKRVGDWNEFKVLVNSPTVALEALLDVPKLYTTGHADESWRLEGWSGYLDTFVVCGFPCSHRPNRYPMKLISGNPGNVGAKYRCRFPAGRDEDSLHWINFTTELVELDALAETKRIVFKHRNEADGNLKLSINCFEHPELPRRETETRIKITTNDRGKAVVRLRFSGPNAKDPRSRVGAKNFWCDYILFRCMLPCVRYEFTVRICILKQLKRIRDYCNFYTPIPRALSLVQISGSQSECPPTAQVIIKRKSSGGEQEVFPNAQDTREESAAEELNKWFQLFKNGGITKAEYEAKKRELL